MIIFIPSSQPHPGCGTLQAALKGKAGKMGRRTKRRGKQQKGKKDSVVSLSFSVFAVLALFSFFLNLVLSSLLDFSFDSWFCEGQGFPLPQSPPGPGEESSEWHASHFENTVEYHFLLHLQKFQGTLKKISNV